MTTSGGETAFKLMIETQTINGCQASVAYFDDTFTPRSKDEATLVKVIFEDNLESVTLRLRDPDHGDVHGKS